MSSNLASRGGRRGERGTGGGASVASSAAKANDRGGDGQLAAQERALPGGHSAGASATATAAYASAPSRLPPEPVATTATSTAGAPCLGSAYGTEFRGSAFVGSAAPVGTFGGCESALDMDVTVLAFAQWVSELKSKQHHSQNHLRTEMSMIRSAVVSNQTDLADFKRHGAAIQQQMQSEINDIREQLSGVFMEITAAVRNNAAADQDIKLKIQSLNEQAVRNETAFAQLADAADQSQSKLRNAVTEMQLSSEQLRDELGSLTRLTDGLEVQAGEKAERICADIDQVSQDVHMQLERRREHLRKMVNDVVAIGESLQSLVGEFGDWRKGTGDAQIRIQSPIAAVDPHLQKETSTGVAGGRVLPGTVDNLPATQPQVPYPLPGHANAGYPVRPDQTVYNVYGQQVHPSISMGSMVYR